jgi:hypothetical protein
MDHGSRMRVVPLQDFGEGPYVTYIRPPPESSCLLGGKAEKP